MRPVEPRLSALDYRERYLPGKPTHNFIIWTGRWQRLPTPLLVVGCVAVGALAALAFRAERGEAAAVLVGATLLDLALLLVLPRLRLSYGPVAGPLCFFTVGRVAVALPCALLGSAALPALVIGQGVLTICSAWAHLVEPAWIGLERVELAVLRSRVSSSAAGDVVRLVQVSDLHIERFGRREAAVLRLIESRRPDVVLFTGDLLNLSSVDDAQAQADARRFIDAIRARWPLLAILGTPTVDDREIVGGFWRAVDVPLLTGRALRMTVRGHRLVFYGLSASMEPHRDARRLSRLLATDPRRRRETGVLLYHTPDLAGELPGIDLYLAGHTHGGQIRLPGIGALVTACQVPRRFAVGTHRFGETTLHVSRGLGFEGLGMPRMRFLCRPEVTEIILRR